MIKYTPTQLLEGRRLIAIADADNIEISLLKNFGVRLDQARLRACLSRPARGLTAAAVLTTRPGLNYTTEAWSKAGWKTTAIARETAFTVRGPELLANADLDIAFEAAFLVATHPHADSLLILTGDGTLARSIAKDVKRRRPSMAVMTMAVPGCASSRLRDTSLFDAYLPIGADVTTAPICPDILVA